MILDRFLYCRICNEAHRITPFDNAPIYDLEGTTVREIAVDDRRHFLDKHDDHGIEKLRSVAENRFSLGFVMDPMKAGYVEVTNGKDFLVLRISRNAIADPVSYKRVSRRMMLWEMTNQAGEDEM